MTNQSSKTEITAIESLIVGCLHRLNDELSEEDKFEVSDNMTLFGSDSKLDSMALVTLIMDVEEAMLDENDADVSLVTEEAMSRSRSPFRSVQTLATYVTELLESNDA